VVSVFLKKVHISFPIFKVLLPFSFLGDLIMSNAFSLPSHQLSIFSVRSYSGVIIVISKVAIQVVPFTLFSASVIKSSAV